MKDRFRFDPEEVALSSLAELRALLDAAGAPVHVEVGFGKDVRLLKAAAADPEGLHVGVEVSRKKFASFCRKTARAGLRNVRAVHADVRDVLRDALPEGSVATCTVLFPDPWPKRRHRKHRWVQEDTARLVARALAPGGEVRVVTDSADYRDQIRACMTAAGLRAVEEGEGAPETTLYAERFARRGAPVYYARYRPGRASCQRPGDRGPPLPRCAQRPTPPRAPRSA